MISKIQDITQPMTFRDSAIAAIAAFDLSGVCHDGLRAAIEALRDAAQAQATRPCGEVDIGLAMTGIGLMEDGAAVEAKHIRAIVELAKIGAEQLEAFEVRDAADRRAIARWQAGDALPSYAVRVISEIVASSKSAPGTGLTVSQAVEMLEGLLHRSEPGNRTLTLPDHADLVVWLMDGIDAQFDGPTVAEVEAIRKRLTAASQRVPSQIADDANDMLGRMADALRAMARRLHTVESQGRSVSALPVIDLPDFLSPPFLDHPAVVAAINAGVIKDGEIWRQPGQAGLAQARRLQALTGYSIKHRIEPGYAVEVREKSLSASDVEAIARREVEKHAASAARAELRRG